MRDIPLLLCCIFIGTTQVTIGGYLLWFPVDIYDSAVGVALLFIGAVFWYLGISLFWKK